MQDRENKETTEAIVETCMNQVTLLQENHGQAVSNIRNKAEQSLIKDYQVDQHKNETPKKQSINVPSLDSIEEMRTLFSQNTLSEEHTSLEKISTKQGLGEANNRTPFLEVNKWVKKKAYVHQLDECRRLRLCKGCYVVVRKLMLSWINLVIFWH